MELIIIIAVVVLIAIYFSKKKETVEKAQMMESEAVIPEEVSASEEYRVKKMQEIEAAKISINEEYKNCQTLEVEIAGVYYRSAAVKDLIPYLDVRDEIKLSKEPKNPYDEYAVKVIYDRKNLGYVPKEYSEIVTQLINEKKIRKVIIERAGDAKLNSWDKPSPYAYIKIFFG